MDYENLLAKPNHLGELPIVRAYKEHRLNIVKEMIEANSPIAPIFNSTGEYIPNHEQKCKEIGKYRFGNNFLGECNPEYLLEFYNSKATNNDDFEFLLISHNHKIVEKFGLKIGVRPQSTKELLIRRIIEMRKV